MKVIILLITWMIHWLHHLDSRFPFICRSWLFWKVSLAAHAIERVRDFFWNYWLNMFLICCELCWCLSLPFLSLLVIKPRRDCYLFLHFILQIIILINHFISLYTNSLSLIKSVFSFNRFTSSFKDCTYSYIFALFPLIISPYFLIFAVTIIFWDKSAFLDILETTIYNTLLPQIQIITYFVLSFHSLYWSFQRDLSILITKWNPNHQQLVLLYTAAGWYEIYNYFQNQKRAITYLFKGTHAKSY